MKVVLPVVLFLWLLLTTSGQKDDYEYDLEDASIRNDTLEENDDSKFTTANIVEVEEKEDSEEFSNAGIDTCGTPPAIEHAKISKPKNPPYAIGTSLSYSCEFGYSVDTSNHISVCTQTTAGSKPKWNDPNIFCIPRSCGDPGFVTNAQRIGSRFTFPNSVSFECDGGYELRGRNIRYCQVNGRWSGSLPSCEKISCNMPDHPENGRVILSSLEYGSELQYECDKGFVLRNHQPRYCSENGTWSGNEPHCVDSQCEIPVKPDHGFVETVGGIPRIGSIAIYSCEKGRTLVGSATSKCLEIGQWTFPTPKCVEPCSVPDVSQGVIGRYESNRWNRNRQKVFKVLPPGTSLESNEELFLRCSKRYEPMGNNMIERVVTCDKGVWSEDPVCEPAKCRSDPPSMENGQASNIKREHGGGVVYHCSRDFKKTKYGNVTCLHGEWKGDTPICSDKRCHLKKLQFPGIIEERKKIYLDKETFKPRCAPGYDVAKPENNIICDEGNWRGHFPPCVAASCLTEPPSPEHGKVKYFSNLHSTIVEYECDDKYSLQKSTEVQCSFGEWKGSPPRCRDNRCHYKDLKFSKGMLAPSSDPTNSGETISVACASGFSRINVNPFCSNGEWTEFGVSPCKENNCPVIEIKNGAITSRLSKWKLTWSGRVKEYYFEKVNVGEMKNVGDSLFVTCDYYFSFQGNNMNDVPIQCTKGLWKPTPICLPPGTIYVEKMETEPAVTENVIAPSKAFSDGPLIRTSTTTEQTLPQTSTSVPVQTESNLKETDDNCFCTYQGLDNLIAYAGKELVIAESKIKPNCVVKFRCLHFGYDRLNGPSEIVCKDCRTWDSSEYPDCVSPVQGDVIIAFESFPKILPSDILEIDQGENVQIKCISNGIAAYPQWTSTASNDYWFAYDVFDQPDGQKYYSSILDIRNAGFQHNGRYRCGVNDYRRNTIQIQVIAKCVTFEESEDFTIHYDRKQNVNSSVMFTCKDKSKKLVGFRTLTCLPNGEWSDQPPKCITAGCQNIEHSANMTVLYSRELEIGSTATFHCFSPSLLKGESSIRCLRNGEWSAAVPSCVLPNCKLEDLYNNNNITENVVPDITRVTNSTVRFGFELPLSCEENGENLRLTDPATAKCGKNGQWEVPKVRCVPGCGSLNMLLESQLIVDPQKENYRMGDLVYLSCAPGLALSKEVELIMCLSEGWSESELPTCVDVSEKPLSSEQKVPEF